MAFNGLLGTSGTPKPSLAQALAQTGPQFQQAPPAQSIDPSMFSGMAPAEGGGEYGSDEWALNSGGPGAMIWRELARGGAYKALDPTSGVFSADSMALLGPQFQNQKKGKA